MEWNVIQSEKDLEDINKKSFKNSQLIFKHSTGCSVSSMVKDKLESGWVFRNEQLAPNYLDLLDFRALSSQIEREYDVRHESPQALIIKGGKCIASMSHTAININALAETIVTY